METTAERKLRHNAALSAHYGTALAAQCREEIKLLHNAARKSKAWESTYSEQSRLADAQLRGELWLSNGFNP